MLRKLVALAVILVSAQLVSGQENYTPQQLTLQDCIKIAQQRNTTVLQAQYSAESQDAHVLSAYGGLLPTFDASTQFTYSSRQSPAGYVVIGGTTVPVSNSSITRTYGAGVSANYTLFNGFANYATVNQANSASQNADLTFERAKQNAFFQATQYYLTVFNDRDQLKISEDNLKRDQQQLESIKESNAVGSASLAQVYQQQSQVSQDEYSLVQAQNKYDQDQATLKFFLGIPVTDRIVFADSTVKSQIDTTEFVSINQRFSQSGQLIEKALQSRPDYQAAEANVSASKSGLAIANAAYSPVVSAFGQYGISGSQTNLINQNKSLYAGLSLSIPILNGFQTQTNIQLADVAMKSSEQTLDATQRQVQLDVYQALLNLNASEKAYEAAVNAVAYNKINLETAQEKFRIGGATLLDVLTANAGYTLALSSQVSAAYNYISAKQQMEFAIGTINY